MARRLILRFALLVFLSASAVGETLPDPTRPPGQSAEDAPAKGSGLQSIIRPEKGKPRALINGVIVKPGDRVGDARLIAIRGDDSVVLLKDDGSREILTTTPDVKKTPVRSTPPARR